MTKACYGLPHGKPLHVSSQCGAWRNVLGVQKT